MTKAKARILVVGCASFDELHLQNLPQPKTVSTVGGAGLYTAIAAAHQGADVTLFAPKPDSEIQHFSVLQQRIKWIGPIVPWEQLPKLEITHHGSGRATLNRADWGDECHLTETDLPLRLNHFDILHISALSSASKQLQFLRHCRLHGALRISVGTYGKLVKEEPDTVRKLLKAADIFFMNENEAAGVFGSAAHARTNTGQLLFVTLGERGANVHFANSAEFVSGCHAIEYDPTGAGDTFCGAALAELVNGKSAVLAAHEGVALAARCIETAGPLYVLQTDDRSNVIS